MEVQIGKVGRGTVVNEDWVVFAQGGDETFLCAKRPLRETMRFGNTADWNSSAVKAYLAECFYPEVVKVFGESNVVGEVRMLTEDVYAKVKSILPKTSRWYWLEDRDQTSLGISQNWVRVVDPDGGVYSIGCGRVAAIRPVVRVKCETVVLVEEVVFA